MLNIKTLITFKYVINDPLIRIFETGKSFENLPLRYADL